MNAENSCGVFCEHSDRRGCRYAGALDSRALKLAAICLRVLGDKASSSKSNERSRSESEREGVGEGGEAGNEKPLYACFGMESCWRLVVNEGCDLGCGFDGNLSVREN